jgi:hypothetical protein
VRFDPIYKDDLKAYIFGGFGGKFAKIGLKVHKIENFFGSDFGICVISLLVMSKY